MYDAIIIGGGPAGMMASIKASENKSKVLLIEKNEKLGKKLYLTGGGRCNLTNLKNNNDFIKELAVNNKFLYSSINGFGPHDIFDYFKNMGVLLKIEDNDRVFPVSNNVQNVIDALYKKMTMCRVEIHTNEYVKKIINIGKHNKEIITNFGVYKAKKIIIATGGLSYSLTGSTGDGYMFSEELNQPLTELYPAETFLITEKKYPLAGVTIDNVLIKFDKYKVKGSILFTHIGITGPAVFKISEKIYHKLKIEKITKIYIDFIPDYSVDELILELNNYDFKKEFGSFFKEYLPKSIVSYIINDNDLKQKVESLSNLKKLSIINDIKNYEIAIKGTGSIEQSIVTGGGVDIKYINPKTMESTINPGIYYAGEVLDIHGHTGGYNITIALSTGYTAGTNRGVL